MGRAPEQPVADQGDPALSWFPRPTSAEDLELLAPDDDVDVREVFDLLSDPAGVEWRHKVGVAGRAEGSAKPKARLLAVRGRVLKTNLADLEPSAEALRARLLAERARASRAGVAHPSKRVLLLRVPGGYLPLGTCLELRTLRAVAEREDRIAGWTEIVDLAIDVHLRCGLGLDLNPANFARAEGSSALFYLDDEVYPTLTVRHVAYFAAARIPEEPAADEATWRAWGRALRDVLAVRGFPRDEDESFVDAFLGYPLASAFDPARKAFVEGLRADPTTLRFRRRPGGGPERVCVLADVHANLPALEAVLARARELGANRYLFVGDAVGYGPHPAACIARLADLPDAVFVRGNHDHVLATGQCDRGMNRLAKACAEWTRERLGRAEVEWLASLSSEHTEEDWMAVHGAPRDPARIFAYVYDLTYEENLAELRSLGAALCWHGHTHVAAVHVALPSGPTKLRNVGVHEHAPSRPCLLNPGSVGQPRDGDVRAAFAMWDRSSARVTFERVPYPLEDTLRDIAREGLPEELAARLRRGA